MNQSLDAISNNMERKLSSNVINLYYYLADNFKDNFMSAAGDAELNFSCQTSYVDISDDSGLNISLIHILLRVLCYKLGANLFEPEHKMKE